MSILRGWSFIKRAIRTRVILTEFDKLCPFQGAIAKEGFCSLELTDQTLIRLQTELRPMLECEQHEIYFNFEAVEAMEELLVLVKPVVKAYVGENVFLDGINFDVKNGGLADQNISSNWHTDNVGTRIKVFVCLNGNGEFPTLIIPSTQRLHSASSWIFNSTVEFFRWVGLSQHAKIANQKSLIHKAGTINIFDTNLLHRGCYEKDVGKRILLQLEFSNPDKHSVASVSYTHLTLPTIYSV